LNLANQLSLLWFLEFWGLDPSNSQL